MMLDVSPSSSAKPVTPAPSDLRIRFDFQSPAQYLDRYAADVSRGGIFVRTQQILPVGRAVRLDLQLSDGSTLIAGEGTVFWTREPDPVRLAIEPGMGIRFNRLTPESQKILAFLLAEKAERERAQDGSDFNDDNERTIVATESELRAAAGAEHQISAGFAVISKTPSASSVSSPSCETPFVLQAPRFDETSIEEQPVAIAPPVMEDPPAADEQPTVSEEALMAIISPRPRRKLAIGLAAGGLMMMAAWIAVASKPASKMAPLAPRATPSLVQPAAQPAGSAAAAGGVAALVFASVDSAPAGRSASAPWTLTAIPAAAAAPSAAPIVIETPAAAAPAATLADAPAAP